MGPLKIQLVPLQLQPLEMQQPPEIEIEHHQLEAQSLATPAFSPRLQLAFSQ